MSQQIAETIRQQIGKLTLMRVAAHDFAFFSGNNKHLGGLTFKVGRNPKLLGGGRVNIALDFDDTYSIVITNNRGREICNKSGIYCEDLAGPQGAIEQETG